LGWMNIGAAVAPDAALASIISTVLVIAGHQSIGAGIALAIPLLCFTGAATRLRLSTLGFFQYIGPTLMFLLAVTFYGEVPG
ncbi:PTS sugar transporter subunit IIC, partial [Salmonella enterica subsp. enterica serovar Montevideo]|nr:PTS sugar transporter subunit IIC [Salmonella enterica subsp. enterica serovar Montevideo]